MEILETPYFRGGRVEQSERTFFRFLVVGQLDIQVAKREKKLEPLSHTNKHSRSTVGLSVKGGMKILESKVGVHPHDLGITKP